MDRQTLTGFGSEMEKIAAQRRRLLAFADELEKIAVATGNDELLKQAAIFRKAGRLMRDVVVPKAYVGATNLVHNPLSMASANTGLVGAAAGGSVGKMALHGVEEAVHHAAHSPTVKRLAGQAKSGLGKLKKKILPQAPAPGTLASPRQFRQFAPVPA
jgi:hypothetical protein